MADYPSRSQLLGADPRAVAAQNLIAETDALPEHDLPAGLEWAANHPGILAYRTKNAERYDNDMRRAHFMERAQEAGLGETPEDEIRKLRSPYEEYGKDWPLYNAGRWFSSLPGAAYAGSQMLANAVDSAIGPKAPAPYPHAYEDLAKNVNNFVAVAEPMGVNKNHMRDMSDMRDTMASVPWQTLRPQHADAMIGEAYGKQAEPKTGRQMLDEAKADELIGRIGAKVLGGMMDATIDPFFSRAKAIPQFLMDYGLGSMHETLPLAIEAAAAAKEYFRPSNAVYY